MYLPAPTLVERLKERKCELCDAMGDLVMHHIRNINQLKADTRWNVVMIKRHRKTLAVCHDCDELIHKSYDKVEKRCWPSLLKEIQDLSGITKKTYNTYLTPHSSHFVLE